MTSLNKTMISTGISGNQEKNSIQSSQKQVKMISTQAFVTHWGQDVKNTGKKLLRT